jgi:SP family myo-inositol transporter-like MFS transporter 13
MYFSATIFAMVGFPNPTATSLLIATTNFLFTLAAFHLIDRIGRRRILLLSIPFMSLGLALSGLSFSHVPLPSNGTTIPPHPASGPWPPFLVTSLLIFVAAYALGLGNVPWHQSELFPLRVRALGSALATATNWGCNSLVGFTFLPMLEVFTPTWTFAVYAVVCGVAWGGVWAVYPERMGRGLEDDDGDDPGDAVVVG